MKCWMISWQKKPYVLPYLPNRRAKMSVAATLERPATDTRNGGSEMLTQSTQDRFWTKVDKSGECWEWQGGRVAQGYGVFWNVKSVRAHRFSYELHFGAIAEGLFVLHRCDNPPCVRPDHLFVGTAAENTADMVSKGRAATGERNAWAVHPECLLLGERNPLAKLDNDAVRVIRQSGLPVSALAARYGVTVGAIAKVKRRSTWAHIT